MKVSFKATKKEYVAALAIVVRAVTEGLTESRDAMDRMMDIIATNANGCPIDMERMVDFDAFNFRHDFLGIVAHMDRKTGKLTDCFVPRCARQEQ